MADSRKLLVPLSLVVIAGLAIWSLASGGGDAPPGGVAPTAAGDADRDPVAARQGTMGTADDPVRREAPSSDDEAAHRTVLVRGRLVEEDGAPVADVAVEFRAGNTRASPFGFDISSRPGSEKAPDGRAVTGSDGAFELSVRADQTGQLRPARDSGYLFHVEQKRSVSIPGYRRDHDLGNLAVVLSASVSGVVSDATGAPVPGAKLRLTRVGRGFVWGGHQTETDENGRFDYPGLDAGEYRLAATAPGFVPVQQELALDFGTNQRDLALRLETGGAIAGRVVDDLGAPIPGAEIATRRARDMGFGGSYQRFDRGEAVEADADGAFRIGGIDAATADLRFWAHSHGEQTMEDVATGSTNVLVTLTRRATISGTLHDVAGRPIAGSRVFLADPSQDRNRSALPMMVDVQFGEAPNWRGRSRARTEDDGSFSISDVAPGTWTVAARGSAHRDVESRPITVRAGQQVEDVALVAEVGAVFEVLVTLADGSPAAGVKVQVRRQPQPRPQHDGAIQQLMMISSSSATVGNVGSIMYGATRGRAVGRGETDEEGRTVIGGLPEGTFDLHATHEELVLPRPVTATAREIAPAPVHLQMTPGGFLALHVVDDVGEPVAEARYEVEGPLGADGDTPKRRGTTDGEGTARVGPLGPGNYAAALQLPPRAQDFGQYLFIIGDGQKDEIPGTRVETRVAAGQTLDVDLVQPVLALLHGVVHGIDGSIAEARVQLRQKTPTGDTPRPFASGPATRTDHAGRFRFEAIPAGEYVVEFRRAVAAVPHRLDVTVPAGVADLAVDLPIRGGQLRVKVIDETGEPVAGARVRVQVDRGDAPAQQQSIASQVFVTGWSVQDGMARAFGDPDREVRTGADGVAEVRDVPAGRYRLTISERRFTTQTMGGVDVAEDRQTDLGTVTLPAAAMLVVEIPGAPADAPVQVRIAPVDDPDARRSQIASGGRTTFRRLEGGRYTVRARLLGGPTSTGFGPATEVTLVADETARAQVGLPR